MRRNDCNFIADKLKTKNLMIGDDTMILLPVSHYDKGFKIRDLTCVDIPFAAACGTYNYINYFLYCGLYVLNANFHNQQDWAIMHKRIAEPLGLKITALDISTLSDNELWDRIVQKLKCNAPAVLVLKETEAFYIVCEEDGVEKEYHGVVINGVDVEQELVLIQDCRMQADLNSKYMPGQAFTSLKLKKTDVAEMIRNSIDYWRSHGYSKFASLFLNFQ